MTAPAISHMICSMSLVALIFVLPFFYSVVVTDVRQDMMTRELKEVADYVSDTLANLFLLVNSTESQLLQKELVFLPVMIEGSTYILTIEANESVVSRVVINLRDDPSISAESWLFFPTLEVSGENRIESQGGRAIAWCGRNGTSVAVGIRYE